MKIQKTKTLVITLFTLIILLAIPIQNVAMIQPSEDPSEQIQVKIYNVADQSMRTQEMDFEEFISFFEPIENLDENNAQTSFQLKIEKLIERQLINEQEKKIIQQVTTSTRSNSKFNVNSKGLFFDLLNVFNGFGFAIKGEKTRSFLDLTVAQFPFLNTNITALFSGFNSFDGNGFIFTLGTNGFRYIYDYDRDTYDFPYFGPVDGWFIGYTGIILEATVSDEIGEKYEGTYVFGVGMNVITLWND
ncbi:MAG: hypothetical protein KGY67_07945 [Candidatus Thermoplasmatota archaeon]|nr:hypothetical protein [Candidatus Thermoplasmatota archaeon]